MTTKRVELNITSIPVSVVRLAAEAGIKFEAPDVELLYKTLISSMSSFLYDNKDRANKTCIKILDTNGPLILAGIVEYHENEDDSDNPGNWSYVLTDKEEDVASCQNSYDIHDSRFSSVALVSAYNDGCMEFSEWAHLCRLLIICAETLKQWLDTNAKEGEITEVALPGYFLASSTIEEREKIFSYVPDGKMKQKIKDDILIEK